MNAPGLVHPLPLNSWRPTAGALLGALCVAALLLLANPSAARADDPCGPPNVVPGNTCNFEGWSGDPPRQLPEGWSPFILSGDPEYANDPHSYFGGGTLRMRSNGGTFKAGIYTTVGVSPGAGYRASVWWGAPNAPDLFGRQLGLDPTGGTDPNAPTVIWGPMHFGDGRFLNYPPGEGPNIDVLARPYGDRMTIFFLVDHPSSSGDNFIYIDVITLVPDENAPQGVPPTPTPEPTATPLPEPTVDPRDLTPATFMPVVQNGAAEAAGPAEPAVLVAAALPATETPTPPPTDTPLPTPTPTATPTPTETPLPTATPTPSPTWTPWPTVAAPSFFSGGGALGGALGSGRTVALPIAPGGEAVRAHSSTVTVALASLSALGLLGSLLFGASLLRLRRRGRA